MIQETEQGIVYGFRLWRKDIGVVLVVLAALGLGLLLRYQVESRATAFQDADNSISLAYPATWTSADTLQDVLLKVQDPRADSAYKTTLTVSARELDPSSPPTLQSLVDRRVAENGKLIGYHFLDNREVVVDGAKGMEIQYAYVTQPIDQPRRASPPVVVKAREYLLVTAARTFYLTLAAPENEFDKASGQFDEILKSVKLQGAK